MSNNLAQKVGYLTTELDQAITQGVCTSDLNMNQNLVGEFRGNGKIEVATLALQGLGDYDKANGFPAGSATLTWQDYALEFDRGRDFEVDDVEDEEAATLTSAKLMETFMSEYVVPEVDAIRFARLAANAGNVVSEDLTTAAAAKASILKAEEALQDYGKDLNSLVFYHTSKVKTLLREATPYQFGKGDDPNTNFTTYDEMKMQLVGKDRFYSAIDLKDGTTSGEVDGGYAKASAGKSINYIVMHPSAAAAIQKHETLRYFAPDVNQNRDAHKWQYRLYHDLLVYLHKKNLIYVSVATA